MKALPLNASGTLEKRLKPMNEAEDLECLREALKRSGRSTMRVEVYVDVPTKRDHNQKLRNWRLRLGGSVAVGFTNAVEALGFVKELRGYLESSPCSQANFGTVQEGSVLSDEKSTVSK